MAKKDQVGFQRDYYDRHFAARRQVRDEQLAHPLFSSWYDRLATRAFDALGTSGAPGGDDGGGEGVPVSEGGRTIRLLEVATGEGLLGAALFRVAARRGITLDYTGTDLSQAAVDQARDAVTGTLIAGDAGEVVAGLPAASADLIIVKNLLHHLDDPTALLRSCARVIAPGGRVIIVEACLGAPQFWVFTLLAPRRERYFFAGRRRNIRAIDAAGLVVRRSEKFSWLPYELAFAVRFRALRHALGSDEPGFIERASQWDERLTRTLPQLASYVVWEAEPRSCAEPSGGTRSITT